MTLGPFHDRIVPMNPERAASVLDGLLDPLSLCLDAESARRLVELRTDPAVRARVDELAGRANEGLLDAEERADYEAILDAADFIAILKLKARRRGRDGA